MRIAVMGAGGVGGYFGARLACRGARRRVHRARQASRGDARARARGQECARRHPPRRGPRSPTIRRASRRPTSCCSAVKLWDTESAADAIRPLLANGGVVIPFQNGVESIERIGAVVGADRVLGGVAYIAATIGEPGVIVHTGTMARLRFGPVARRAAARCRGLAAACRSAGIEAELSADIRRALWEKFAFLAAFSGLTSVARQPMGVLRGDPDLRAALEAAIARDVGGRPRQRHRARRRFRRPANAVRRGPPRGNEILDAERSRRGQPARGAVAVRRRGENGQRRGSGDTRQCDALRRPQTLLRRRRAVAPVAARNRENPSCCVCCSSGS